MDSRERITRIFNREKADRPGFWLGTPKAESWQRYFNYFHIQSPDHSNPQAQEALRRQLGDDLRWICPQWSSYKHPQNKPMWQHQHDDNKGLASEGVFADTTDPDDVEKIEWPNPDYLDFSEALHRLKNAGPHYRLSGMWCPFFHDLPNFFGMENYFVKMYTDPEVVHAVTRKICDFYLQANDMFFQKAGKEVDAFFLGNDFGTQRDLLISPDAFDTFVMPWFKKFTEQGHAHGYQVVLHSCGSITRVIDRLIDANVNALHPLQAKAANMNAETLHEKFHNRIAFMGGIDTQDLLVNATPAQVKADVLRVKTLLGPNLVISPSHEALLPNIPPENIEAMAQAVRE